MNTWRRIGTWSAAVLAMAGTVLVGAQPASANAADGSFSLRAGTGKCIEVVPDPSGNFYVAGNRIQQRSCDGSPQQQWFLQELPGNWRGVCCVTRYHIVNRMTLQCLDDMNGDTNNRNPVQQWTCNANSTSMVWSFWDDNTLGYELDNEKAAKCLDVTDGLLQDGTRLQIYNCFDEENIAQHFLPLF